MLGGYTGDVLGAVEQVYEITFLLVLARSALILVRHPKPL